MIAKTLTISLSSDRPTHIGRRRGGWILHLIPVRGDIYNSTIFSTERLCGGGTSALKHKIPYSNTDLQAILQLFRGTITFNPPYIRLLSLSLYNHIVGQNVAIGDSTVTRATTIHDNLETLPQCQWRECTVVLMRHLVAGYAVARFI